MATFEIEIPVDDPEAMVEFQTFMNKVQAETDKYVCEMAKDMHIPVLLAYDIWYLRQRSRWTQALEDRILRCAKEKGVDNFKVGAGEEEEILQLHGY